ncbi:hypothetical protein CT688_11045 [Dietzia sp. JS16-p6b]|nr:hypothetical protein CT688_11045 [Dietzia sp. JS16-p6b]
MLSKSRLFVTVVELWNGWVVLRVAAALVPTGAMRPFIFHAVDERGVAYEARGGMATAGGFDGPQFSDEMLFRPDSVRPRRLDIGLRAELTNGVFTPILTVEIPEVRNEK